MRNRFNKSFKEMPTIKQLWEIIYLIFFFLCFLCIWYSFFLGQMVEMLVSFLVLYILIISYNLHQVYKY